MNGLGIPDPITDEHYREIIFALVADRGVPVPKDVLDAETDQAVEWARGVLLNQALLDLVMEGRATLSIVEGELYFRKVQG